MLGKLIKHELRAMARILPLAFIPVVFFAAVLKVAQILNADMPILIFSSVLAGMIHYALKMLYVPSQLVCHSLF